MHLQCLPIKITGVQGTLTTLYRPLFILLLRAFNGSTLSFLASTMSFLHCMALHAFHQYFVVFSGELFFSA